MYLLLKVKKNPNLNGSYWSEQSTRVKVNKSMSHARTGPQCCRACPHAALFSMPPATVSPFSKPPGCRNEWQEPEELEEKQVPGQVDEAPGERLSAPWWASGNLPCVFGTAAAGGKRWAVVLFMAMDVDVEWIHIMPSLVSSNTYKLLHGHEALKYEYIKRALLLSSCSERGRRVHASKEETLWATIRPGWVDEGY